MVSTAPRSAYIHVPFCQHRCGYCDFAVIAGRNDLIEPFLQAIAVELSWLEEPRPVNTLYFGGGTPTELSTPQLARLGELAVHWHPLGEQYEWTVEANPESLTREHLRILADCGVNRVSLGIQSLNDAKLISLDRRHSRQAAYAAVDIVKSAGLQVSIDLMFAAPGEAVDGWRRDLRDTIALDADHVSTYGLTFERGTAFFVQRNRGTLVQTDEETERAMYAEAIDALAAAGYEHYEVSNFARPGRRSRHNETYWAGDEYFAAGPGAARYVAGVRETNVRSTLGYLRCMACGKSPVAEREQLSPERRARERLVLGLRRLAGVDRRRFEQTTGFTIDALAGAAVSRFVALHLLENDGDCVRLTRDGLFVSDALWPALL
jgi:oxygen-independent coproporphyrinogen-3 oxidase